MPAPSDSLPPLSYVTQPVHENLIVTPRAGGATNTVLPNRRQLRHVWLEFATIVSLAGALNGVLYIAMVNNGAYWEGLLITGVVGAIVIGRSAWKILLAHRASIIDADPTGIRFAPAHDTPWGLWLGHHPSQWPAAQITDVVATRFPHGDKAGNSFYLQLRLRDGVSINLGSGTEAEVCWLTTLVSSALGPPIDWNGGDEVRLINTSGPVE